MAASTVPMTGKGLTLTFSGFTARIVDASNIPSVIREALDITHQGSGVWRDYTPAPFVDGEEISFECHTNDTDSPVTLITSATATLLVTLPTAIGRSSAATWSVSAMVTKWTNSLGLNGIGRHSISFKPTGTPTFTVGS